MMRAIETRYNGYRFRSRLEARWAVFFDALGIQYQYEPEGYELSDGTRYLPDFWLHSFHGGMLVEVKPDGGNFAKAIQLSREEGFAVWLAEGLPDTRVYTVYEPGCPWGDSWVGIPNADQAHGEDRMYAAPEYEDEDGRIRGEALGHLGDHYHRAVEAAKSARFEHGEVPFVIDLYTARRNRFFGELRKLTGRTSDDLPE